MLEGARDRARGSLRERRGLRGGARARAVSPHALAGAQRWTTASIPTDPPAASPVAKRVLSETLPQITVPSPEKTSAPARDQAQRSRDHGDVESTTLIGRTRDLDWARGLLARGDGRTTIAFWGRAGVGRTTLLGAIAAKADRAGALVVRVPLAPAPRCFVGYEALRAMIAELSGMTRRDLDEARGVLVELLDSAVLTPNERAQVIDQIATLARPRP